MINRRAPRPSRAVENLQQFCLNNSAGIDCTAPHNNVKNVYNSKNLVVNLDGSLSLRKPLLLKTAFAGRADTPVENSLNVLKVFPIGIDDTCIVAVRTRDGVEGMYLVDKTLKSIAYNLTWYDVDDVKREHSVQPGLILRTDVLNILDASAVKINTGVLLSNCVLNLTTTRMVDDAPITSLYSKALYDENTFKVPRVVTVVQESSTWRISIHSAAPNVYSLDDTFPTNLLLDNAYATRDVYNASAPAIKAIRAYVLSELKDGVPKPVRTYSSLVPISQTISHEHTYTDTNPDSWRVFYARDDSFEIPIAKGWKIDAIFNTQFSIATLGTSRISAHTTAIFTLMYDTFPVEHKVDVVLRGLTSLKYTLTYQSGIAHRVFTFEVTGSGFLKNWYSSVDKIEGEGVEVYQYDFGSRNLTTTVQDYELTAADIDGIAYASALTAKVQLNDLYLSGTVYSEQDEYYASYDTIASVTESVKQLRWRAASSLNLSDVSTFLLKCFINAPKNLDNLYISWRYSSDGVNWAGISPNELDYRGDRSTLLDTSYAPIDGIDTSEPDTSEISFPILRVVANSQYDNCNQRADVLRLKNGGDGWDASLIKAVLCTVSEDHKLIANYGEAVFAIPKHITELEYSEIGNAALGFKTYASRIIYSYGSPFLNNIFYTYPNELDVPLSNVIDISTTTAKHVTFVTPWREHILATTSDAMYLCSKTEQGYVVKTVNAVVGLPTEDCKCCTALLNGILFKSGTKVYQMYPNVYAGVDDMLQITDISQPISHILENYTPDDTYSAFAFATSSEWVLMLPQTTRTISLVYNITNHCWSMCEYPVTLFDASVRLDDIRLYGVLNGQLCEFYYNKLLEDVSVESFSNALPYGDVLTQDIELAENVYGYTFEDIINSFKEAFTANRAANVMPISFALDTGQKAEAIVTTKQFVETKFVLATLDKADTFPMQLTVHIDGDPHIITRDISTDAAFWKDNSAKGILNTTFSGLSDSSDTFNVLRQLVVRYSGKGKSIRHILEGQSLSNFKLYETYIRYKLLNVKQ